MSPEPPFIALLHGDEIMHVPFSFLGHGKCGDEPGGEFEQITDGNREEPSKLAGRCHQIEDMAGQDWKLRHFGAASSVIPGKRQSRGFYAPARTDSLCSTTRSVAQR